MVITSEFKGTRGLPMSRQKVSVSQAMKIRNLTSRIPKDIMGLPSSKSESSAVKAD